MEFLWINIFLEDAKIYRNFTVPSSWLPWSIVWLIFKYFHIYRDLSYGRGNTAPIKEQKLPEIVKTEAWDGKDGELPQEEDIDLSDVDLDEKDEL